MDLLFGILLAGLITFYPLKKIDDYIFEKRFKEPDSKILVWFIKVIAVIFALSWFIFSCYLSSKIIKYIEYFISSL